MLEDFENLEDFFADFSTTAIVQSANSAITELTGIFDENYQDMFGGFDQSSEGRKFCFKVQTQLIKGLRNGDRLTIHNHNYQIVSVQPQHDGKLTNIILKQDLS